MGTTCCKGSDPQDHNEYNFQYSPEQLYNPNEKAAGPPHEAGSSEQKKAASLESARGFQMVTQWSYTVGGIDISLGIDKLTFSYTQCKFTGEGTDEHGKFRVEGTFNLAGEVTIKLIHETSAVLGKNFEGKFSENVIAGDWTGSEAEKGTFRLELVAHVWHSEQYFVSVKSLTEYMGVGKFPYGYGLVTGTPINEETVHLDIVFGDEKRGSYDFKLGTESIKGQARWVGGEQELYLLFKNEFA